MRVIREHTRSGVQLVQLDDGKFAVIAGDQVLVETSVESLADLTYEDAVSERDPAKEIRARERAHYDMQAMRSESFARRAANARKTGGKGGRGGV